MPGKHLLLMALVSTVGTDVQVPAICDTRSVRTELERMLHSDQASRNGNAPDVDKENAVRLAGIVDNCGWPPVSEFGREAALGAFLILQHADLDLQMELVPLLRAADRAGELPPGTPAPARGPDPRAPGHAPDLRNADPGCGNALSHRKPGRAGGAEEECRPRALRGLPQALPAPLKRGRQREPQMLIVWVSDSQVGGSGQSGSWLPSSTRRRSRLSICGARTWTSSRA